MLTLCPYYLSWFVMMFSKEWKSLSVLVKGWGSAVLHCIQKFTNTYEVTMQVKHDIGKTILHKLPIYYEYMIMYLFWVSILFVMICHDVFQGMKITTRHLPYITVHLRFKWSKFLGARSYRNAMKRSIDNCFSYVQ